MKIIKGSTNYHQGELRGREKWLELVDNASQFEPENWVLNNRIFEGFFQLYTYHQNVSKPPRFAPQKVQNFASLSYSYCRCEDTTFLKDFSIIFCWIQRNKFVLRSKNYFTSYTGSISVCVFTGWKLTINWIKIHVY